MNKDFNALMRIAISAALDAPAAARKQLFGLLPEKGLFTGPYYTIGRFLAEDATTNTVDVQAVAHKIGMDPVELATLYGLDETFRPLKEHLVRLLSARQTMALSRGEDVTRWAAAIVKISEVALPSQEVDGEETLKNPLFENAPSFLTANIKIEYLIHKLFELCALIAIVGPSGQYKSFVAICIACCVACGLPWNGRKVKQGAVLYLAGEGRSGIIRRVKAWMIHHGLLPGDLNLLYLSKNTLMMDGSNIGQIVEEMKGIDVSLIIVDTLARHIDGHENDTLDMGTFVNHVDALKYRLGAAAIVVHHTGHQDTGRARGNTSFRAALDTEMICDKGTLTFTKCKDAEPPEKIEFKLHQVVIGTDDETGEDITSAVCVYGERSTSQKAATLTPFETMALDALVTVCIAENDLKNGQHAGSFDAWRNEFYRIRRIEDNSLTAGTLKKSFQLVTGTTNRGGGLKGKGFVGFVEGRGAIPLRIADQDKIFNSILAGGNREQDGNKTGTVPVSGGGNTGTHLYNRCSLFPSDIPNIPTCDEIEEIEEIPEAA